MLIEIFLALIFGIIAGTFTGIFPGIHINLVSLMIFTWSGFLLKFAPPIVLAAFIVSMAITHTFLDFIPSIFLGAPEEATSLSVLPGHSLLLKGRGYEAVRLASIGSLSGVILTAIFVPVFLFALPAVYGASEKFIPLILILSSAFLIYKEGKGKKTLALMAFLISGVLGVFVLDFNMIREPLFPLLTGLFGTSMLFTSLNNNTKIPKQTLDHKKINKKEFSKAIKASVISSPLCSFLPGLGASQAAVIGSSFTEMDERVFLILLGMIGTFVTGLNFASLYIIGKGRSGASVIIGKLVELNLSSLSLLIAVMIASGGIALLLSLYFAKVFSRFIEKVNYRMLSIAIILLLVALSIMISGPLSLIVLMASTSLGVYVNESGIKKMHMMGCLIIPVIFYLLF